MLAAVMPLLLWLLRDVYGYEPIRQYYFLQRQMALLILLPPGAITIDARHSIRH